MLSTDFIRGIKMQEIIKRVKSYYTFEKNVLEKNKNAIDKKNLKLLRLILFCNMFISLANILATFLSDLLPLSDIFSLRYSYICCFLSSVIMYILIRLRPNMNSTWYIYFVYSMAAIYCIITASLVSPNYISVFILAILFQIPILYLDKSWRINIFVIIISVIYLISISHFKSHSIFIDESLNIIVFSAISLIIGTPIRTSMLENIDMKRELQYYAYTDTLTKLSNRRKLYQDLADIERIKNKTAITGMAIIDIDYFKEYNDSYGHQAGDECLKKIANCFLKFQSKYNIFFYRYGGEEFLILFQEYSEKEMYELSIVIRKAIEKINITCNCTKLIAPTVSIGVASFSDSEKNFDKLFSKADKALYEAKSQGRNNVVFFDECMI